MRPLAVVRVRFLLLGLTRKGVSNRVGVRVGLYCSLSVLVFVYSCIVVNVCGFLPARRGSNRIQTAQNQRVKEGLKIAL